MPLPIPFILGGLGAILGTYTAGTAVANTMASQSKQAAMASEARRDVAAAARTPKPIAPPPKKPDPPKPPKPAPKPPKPKPTPKPPRPTPEVSAEPEAAFSGVSSLVAAAETPVAAIKSAPIDTVEFVDETLSAELLLDLLFEDVGGQELLTIARNDTVNGQDVVYQPFKNLGILQEIYNPTKLLRLQETSDKIFSNFTINLRDKIPKVGNGENGANYYLDLAARDGIIEFVNLRSDEQVEVQIVTAGIIEDVGI